MKPKIITSIITLYIIFSCSHQEEINVLFEKNEMIEYLIKKLDTVHTYNCKTKKLTDVGNQVIFKLCNEHFINSDAANITYVKSEDLKKNNFISMKNFLENYSHLRGVENDNKIFFLEKNDDNSYQKYLVKWSKDFYDYEPSQMLY
ncbi:MAG: hypothetical protein AAF611_15000 [Bacteroidota bacterium]